MSQNKKEHKEAKPSLEPSREMLLAVGQIFSLIEGFNGVQRGYILSRIQDTYLKPKNPPKGKVRLQPPKEKKQTNVELDSTPEAKEYHSMYKALKAKYKVGLKEKPLTKLVTSEEEARYNILKEKYLSKKVEIAKRFREEGHPKDGPVSLEEQKV